MPTPWAMGRSPSPFSQRRNASLTWTTDTSRNAMGPPRQRHWRPSRMSFRPALVDPQGGPMTGKEGGPMSLAKPAINWSHVTGKRQMGGAKDERLEMVTSPALYGEVTVEPFTV